MSIWLETSKVYLIPADRAQTFRRKLRELWQTVDEDEGPTDSQFVVVGKWATVELAKAGVAALDEIAGQ